MKRIETLNSVYELDEQQKMVRRVSGVNEPTPRQGPDGVWKPYFGYRFRANRLFIQWDARDIRGTVTSLVLFIDEVPDVVLSSGEEET